MANFLGVYHAGEEEELILSDKGLVKVKSTCMCCKKKMTFEVEKDDVSEEGELLNRGIRKLCSNCKSKKRYINYDFGLPDARGSLPKSATPTAIRVSNYPGCSGNHVSITLLSQEEIRELETQYKDAGQVPDLETLKLVRSGKLGRAKVYREGLKKLHEQKPYLVPEY